MKREKKKNQKKTVPPRDGHNLQSPESQRLQLLT
jgi:hypothetical protein